MNKKIVCTVKEHIRYGYFSDSKGNVICFFCGRKIKIVKIKKKRKKQ